MRKRILATLLTLVMLLGLMPTMALANEITPIEITPDYEWYGDGEAEEFTISTVEDLAGLANITNGKDGQAKFDFAGKTVKLGDDLTFADNQYLYYANTDNTVIYDYKIGSFAGTFDGQENTITGLKFCNENISQNPYMYLFNTITVDGSIKNITLDTVTADINGSDYFGFLAKTFNGSAENCHVNNAVANVTVNNDDKAYLAQTAAMFGYVSSATITDCTVSDFTINAPNGQDTTDRVAALVGQANGTAEKRTVISNCSVSDVEFILARKTKILGGFVGQANNTIITDCTVTDINITVGTYYQNVGGFAGTVGGNTTFENCNIARFVLDANSTDYAGYVGGFTASASGDLINFINCHVTELNMDLEYRDYDYGYIGGFASSMGGSGSIKVTNCSVSGEISAVGIDSNLPTGGFFGQTSNTNLVTDSCTANVNVTAPYTAGGFVGIGKGGTFTNCEVNGDISGETAGGFVGIVTPDTNSTGKTIIIDSCEVTGTVTGTEVASGFVGTLTTAGESDANATLVSITNSSTKSEVTGATEDTEIIDFAKETVAEGSTSHYESTGNKAFHKYVTLDENEYYSFEEALEEAANGDTITLIGDVEEADIEITKNIVIDLGGNTLAGNFIVSGIATFKNGTVDATASGVSTFALSGDADAIAVDGGAATIESGTYNGGLSTSNEGTITVNAGTFSKDPTAYLADGLTATQTNTGWVVGEMTEAEFVVSADKTEVKTGEEVTVTLTVNGNDLVGAGWTLTFEDDKFEQVGTGSLSGEWESAGNPTNSKVLATYTFKALAQDSESVVANFSMADEDADAWDYNGAMTGKVDATVIPADVTIIYDTMDVSVNVNDEAQTEDNKTIDWNGTDYTVSIDAPATAYVATSVKIDGVDAENNLTFNLPGTYEVTYTVTQKGYTTVEKTFTLTIDALDMTASVEVDGAAQTEKSLTDSFKEDSYTVVIIPSEADAVVTMNGDEVSSLKFTDVGEYEISYTVTKTGYTTVTDTFTLTITEADMTAPVMINGIADENVTKEVTYTEVDSYTITVDAPEGAIVAYELNDTPANAEQLTFNMPGTYKVGYTVTKTGYKTVTGTYTLVINKATMNVPVSVNGDVQTETSNSFDYITGGYTVTINPSVTDTTVSYKVNGANSASLTFVDAGTYEITYTVTKTGYEDVSGTFTLTINDIDYVVEVNLTDADTADYVAGKKIVLVYTDNDYVSFAYGDKTMFDVTARGYKYNGETEYANVYAIVVDSIDTDTSTDGKQALLSDYEANVRLVKSELAANYVIEYSKDLNKDTKLTLRDVSVAYGVVNQYEPYFINFMANVLMADIDGDKVADEDDAKDVKTEYDTPASN